MAVTRRQLVTFSHEHAFHTAVLRLVVEGVPGRVDGLWAWADSDVPHRRGRL